MEFAADLRATHSGPAEEDRGVLQNHQLLEPSDGNTESEWDER